jgi:hypothetical protein
MKSPTDCREADTKQAAPDVSRTANRANGSPIDTTKGAGFKYELPTSRQISFYDSAKDVAPSREITIRDFCRMVHDGETAAAVALVRAAGTDDEKRNAKMRLPAVQLSGFVTEGKRAKAMEERRFLHSGFLQLDVDGDGLNGKSPEEARALLASDPHVLSAFISPSGQGAKALFRIRPSETTEQHKAQFAAVEKHISESYGMKIDPATKDPGRLCYLPSDPECTWNGNPVEFVIPPPLKGNNCPLENTAAPLVIRSKHFPEPPENGIHSWLMEAAWHCRLHDRITEAETVAKLESYNGRLRRPLQPTEARDAARTVFSAILQPYGTRATIDKIREAALPSDFPDLTRFAESDADNALRVHAVAGGNFHHVAESGQWLVWDGCRWNPDKDGKMVRLYLATMEAAASQAITMENRKAGEALVKHAMRCRDAAKVASALTMLKSVQGVTISANDLDADPWLIGTPSGLIDLRTGQPIAPDKRALARHGSA